MTMTPITIDPHYRLMFTNNKAVMLLINPDDGAIIDVSQGACAFYGYSHSELTGMTIFNINTMDKAKINAVLHQARQEAKNHFNLRHRLASGEVRDVEVISYPISMEDQNFLYSIVSDVTDRMKTEQALQESEQRFRTIFNNVFDGILVVDTDGMQFVDANDTICKMLGYEYDELVQLGVMSIHPEKDLPYVLTQFEKQWKSETTLAKNIPMLTKDGSTFYADISSAPFRLGERTCLARVVRDITERKKIEDELTYLATHDSLTGLYNREDLQKRLIEEVTRATRYNHPLSLFMLDLDHFKQVNDTEGHRVGDVVLRDLAQLLDGSVRQSDYVARYGGEEFIVILPETPLSKAKALAERLCRQIEEHSVVLENHKEINVTVSIGVAGSHDNGESWEDLINDADSAMYVAKERGRNCVGVHNLN